ncbi:hypothetical protein [Sutterella seckii]|uniref:hypothetical protein n=1 Tax=Sutterella seckii TaxID=1944635 RepID=UPI001D0559D0|nr:hypothetical protein [Sutterella seckii]
MTQTSQTIESTADETFAEGLLRGIRTTLPLLAGIIPLAFILGTQAPSTGSPASA